MDKEAGKKSAALRAVEFVENGMTLGLGTGSTAEYFVDAIGGKVRSGWEIKGVATSHATAEQARSVGVNVIMPDETTVIDLAIDGTDEADPQLNLIKGGGGALLREKIVASAAEKFIIIADKSKRVSSLGAFPLPVEIEPYCWALTISTMRKLFHDNGFSDVEINLRGAAGAFTRSDGGHYIADCKLLKIENPQALDMALKSIPGVIETGLFCAMADTIIYGDENDVSVEDA